MTISPLSRPVRDRIDRLDRLEAEAIHKLREVVGQSANPVLLFSAGKGSLCLLRLAEKAFRPGRFPFPLLHLDSGHNFLDVLAFRDWRVAELDERLIVRVPAESIRRGAESPESRESPGDAGKPQQSATLREAIEEHAFDVGISGARGRSILKSRRAERRDTHQEGNMLVFPIADWTELDVWRYIEREGLELPSIYFAHRCPVVRGNGVLQPVTALTPAREEDQVENLRVRFRTLDDIPHMAPVESDADSVAGIIAEMANEPIAEHRLVDFDESGSAKKRRKQAGYFR